MLSNFEIKFFIILILVEILDPPIMQVTGLVMLDVIFFNALISKSSCNPEKDGKNFEISQTDACALCEHEKASFT